MSVAPSSIFILKSTARVGGTVGKSSRKTSEIFFTIGTLSMVISFTFMSAAQANMTHYHCPYCCFHYQHYLWIATL